MLAIPLYDDTPRLRTPVVTYGLIGACVATYLWQAGLDPRAATGAAFRFGMVPAVLFGQEALPRQLQTVPAWATLFTSMFLHGGLLHLAGNMLYLWIFGKGVESALGASRFLVLYVVCGVAAALTQAFVDPTSDVPMIGASGAIAGALGAYLLLYPRSNVVVFIWIIVLVRLITVPAPILLGLWFLLQLMSAAASAPGEPGVAFWAHVGGFLAGMVLVMVLRQRHVVMFQPSRSRSFQMGRPRDAHQGFGRGSVPSVGRRQGPWR
jgi:membrane associated rhomboid family serine protease